MTLTLTVLRCPAQDRHVAPETRRVESGTFVLGRAGQADWVLAEPGDKPQLSRRHCVLISQGSNWTLTDLSTNGTMLNGERTQHNVPTRALRAGDRLALGEYEIEIGLAPAAAYGDPGSGFGTRGASDATSEGLYPGRGFDDAHGHSTGFEESAPASVRLPEGFGTEFSAAEKPAFVGIAAQFDHSPAQDDVIRLPQARMTLPAEWDTAPDASRVLRMAPEPMPAMVEPARPALVADALLDAFLDGAGMASAARPGNAAAAMREAGAAFRAFVQGLRRVMMARAEVKSAFRIEQTMVRSRRNNPLKFAAGDDDALAALLGSGRHSDMTAAAAVEGALTDIRLHELATMAAMREAVQAMLGRLDPARFLSTAGASMLPASRRARAFDLFEAEFQKLREAYSEKFDDAFGKAFAVAYERVVNDLRMRSSEQDQRAPDKGAGGKAAGDIEGRGQEGWDQIARSLHGREPFG
nr:type VI secretion system-associated FHA domain protein TagH [uncultured Lichenicoccus sp.]